MSKVKIDTEKISGSLIPLAKNHHSQISGANSYASRVNYPHDDYNWGNVKSKIQDCVERAAKYSNWINAQNSKLNSAINSLGEEITDVTVDAVRKNVL